MTGPRLEAALVLADGTTFEGEAIGWQPPNGIATGEVVFNTVLSGYQEVLTDPGTEGVDLVATVTTAQPYHYGEGPLRVVAYDFGIKRNILRHLGRIATVEVVPASTPADDVLARRVDGVFLSNGPGDPAAV